MQLTNEYKYLLSKLFRGKADKSEIQKLNKWYDSADKKLVLYIEDSHYRSVEELKNNVYSKLENEILQKEYKRSFNHSYLVAASISALLIFSLLYFFIANSSKSSEYLTKTTNLGEKSIVTFSDGSKITLNANSELKYPRKFDKDTRTVYLSGEAFCEITKNKEKPFRIITEKLTTTVLGTKFNVSAFPDEENIQVSLIEGKVKVNLGDTEKILNIKEQLNYNKSSDNIKVSQFDMLEITGWRQNILAFKNSGLNEVLKKLERQFGIELEVKDKLQVTKKFTGNFDNVSFWVAIKTIQTATGFDYKTEENNGELTKLIFE